MDNSQLIMNANAVVDELQKAPADITREDILRFVRKTTYVLSTFFTPAAMVV